MRKGQLRVQVDRWPLTDAGVSEHVLTVIIVGAYTRKPTLSEIINACDDAAKIVREVRP